MLTKTANVIMYYYIEGVGSMLFSNFNIKTKTLKILSLVLTLAGIVFILFSSYIGRVAIRIAMVAILVFYTSNMKMTYKYLTKKERINHLFIIAASIIGLFRPELIMLITGILLLYISVPPYINVIKSKDYSDVVMLGIYGIGILFAAYCIINSQAALNTVVKIIGIVFTVAGCLTLYEVITGKNSNADHDSNEYSEYNGFEDTNNM